MRIYDKWGEGYVNQNNFSMSELSSVEGGKKSRLIKLKRLSSKNKPFDSSWKMFSSAWLTRSSRSAIEKLN